MGPFVAKNIAAALEVLSLVTYSDDAHHLHPALGTNPLDFVRCVRDKGGSGGKASQVDTKTANEIFTHARAALDELSLDADLLAKLKHTDNMAMNVCKCYAVLKDFLSAEIVKPRLRRESVIDSHMNSQ